MNSIVTLAGPRPALDIRELSNYEAGLAFLGTVNQLYPGIKIKHLHQLAYGNRPETMGRKWWEKVGGALNPVNHFDTIKTTVGEVKDGIGDVLKDSFDATADAGGSLVRLLSDEKVIDGINSSYESFTSSGGVSGAVVGDWGGDWTGGEGGEEGGIQQAGKKFFDFIVQAGASAKKKANAASVGGEFPSWALPVGIGAVVLLWAVPRLAGGRK